MKVIGVIPARYGSTRFPGKPLEKILNKPLLQWVVEGAKKSRKLSQVLVATDDSRIAELCQKIGIEFVMTSSELPTGTDRIWAAIEKRDCDIVINIQGDEPLIDGEIIDTLIEAFEKDSQISMATLGTHLTPEELQSSNVVKIVVNQKNQALYFSRFAIPYSREKASNVIDGALKHIGMYGYRKSFLKTFCQTPQTTIEKMESLEQLRALYLGAQIQVVSTSYQCIGVDSPEDILKVEEVLNEKTK